METAKKYNITGGGEKKWERSGDGQLQNPIVMTYISFLYEAWKKKHK